MEKIKFAVKYVWEEYLVFATIFMTGMTIWMLSTCGLIAVAIGLPKLLWPIVPHSIAIICAIVATIVYIVIYYIAMHWEFISDAYAERKKNKTAYL